MMPPLKRRESAWITPHDRPEPIYALIAAGNLLIPLFNILRARGLKKKAAMMTGPGTRGGTALFNEDLPAAGLSSQ